MKFWLLEKWPKEKLSSTRCQLGLFLKINRSLGFSGVFSILKSNNFLKVVTKYSNLRSTSFHLTDTDTSVCKRIHFHQILVDPIRLEYFSRPLNRKFSLSYCFMKTHIPNKEKKIVVLINLWEYIKNTFDNNKKYLNVFSFSNELT